MDGDLHVHVGLGEVEGLARLLHRIDRKLDLLLAMEGHEMADLTRIKASVQANGDAEQSAIALLNELAQMVRDNASDPQALNDLADTLDQNASDLSAAVVANTPADTSGGSTGGDTGDGDGTSGDGGATDEPVQ